MGKYKVIIPEPIQKQIVLHNKSGDKSIINKIEKILVELENTPYIGIGNPEQLKYNLTGFWSRRINQKHRLIYKVEEALITVLVYLRWDITTINNNAKHKKDRHQVIKSRTVSPTF